MYLLAAQWMQKPNPLPGCPIGLEYLTQVDRLSIQQMVELLEAFTNWETNNKYVIRNANGQQVFYAFESKLSAGSFFNNKKKMHKLYFVVARDRYLYENMLRYAETLRYTCR